MKFSPQRDRDQVKENECRSQNYMPGRRRVKLMNLGERDSDDRGMAGWRNAYLVLGMINNSYQKPFPFSNLSGLGLLHGTQKAKIKN